MQRLYEMGARRVVVTGTGMIGCVPAELAMHSVDGECARDLTEAADLFNPQLVRMLAGLNADIGSDVFIAANTNRVSFDFMFNPQDYGTHARTHLYLPAGCMGPPCQTPWSENLFEIEALIDVVQGS